MGPYVSFNSNKIHKIAHLPLLLQNFHYYIAIAMYNLPADETTLKEFNEMILEMRANVQCSVHGDYDDYGSRQTYLNCGTKAKLKIKRENNTTIAVIHTLMCASNEITH